MTLAKVAASTGEIVQAEWGEISWKVSKTLNNGQEMSFGIVTVWAGHANPLHYHPNCEETLYVLAGELEHVVNNEVIVLQAGDTLVIPRETVHGAMAVGAEDAVALVAFSNGEREIVFV